MIQAARIIGTRLATTGLIGAGVGIGVVFAALILGVARNSSLKGQLFSYAINAFELPLSKWILFVFLMCSITYCIILGARISLLIYSEKFKTQLFVFILSWSMVFGFITIEQVIYLYPLNILFMYLYLNIFHFYLHSSWMSPVCFLKGYAKAIMYFACLFICAFFIVVAFSVLLHAESLLRCLFDFIGLDTSHLVLGFDASTIQGISQNQINIFMRNLVRSIAAVEATGVQSVTYHGLLNGAVTGPEHYATADLIMGRVLNSLSTPDNPVGMFDIALQRAEPGAPYTKSRILSQIMA